MTSQVSIRLGKGTFFLTSNDQLAPDQSEEIRSFAQKNAFTIRQKRPESKPKLEPKSNNQNCLKSQYLGPKQTCRGALLANARLQLEAERGRHAGESESTPPAAYFLRPPRCAMATSCRDDTARVHQAQRSPPFLFGNILDLFFF